MTATVSAARLLALLSLLILSANGGASVNAQQADGIIIDSDLSLADALGAQEIPGPVKEQLRLVAVSYYSFDGKLHRGQLIIHRSLQRDIVEIFRELERARFPIAKVIPVSKYNYSDDDSMADNNTSAFNYRRVEGTRTLSKHAFGRAIDINPFLNPVIQRGVTRPEGATYNPRASGAITKNGLVARAFRRRGWQWGGGWKNKKDYQHFEKGSNKP
jgi:peptidoglycan L-alanyl-D-glutamate endopeptidase CwlK